MKANCTNKLYINVCVYSFPQLTSEVAQCKPISNIVDSMEIVACSFILDSVVRSAISVCVCVRLHVLYLLLTCVRILTKNINGSLTFWGSSGFLRPHVWEQYVLPTHSHAHTHTMMAQSVFWGRPGTLMHIGSSLFSPTALRNCKSLIFTYLLYLWVWETLMSPNKPQTVSNINRRSYVCIYMFCLTL